MTQNRLPSYWNESLENKLINLNEQPVLLDKDVAELYAYEPIKLRQQIKRNIDKFPKSYAYQLSDAEVDILVSQNVIPSKKSLGGHNPWVFTEKGAYMAATILKSKKATEATFAIIETFAKIRELSRNIAAFENTKNEAEQNMLAKKSGEILADIIDVEPIIEKQDDDAIEIETRAEINLGIAKVSRTVKKKKSDK